MNAYSLHAALVVAILQLPAIACAQDTSFVPTPLKTIAEKTFTDPLGIWSDQEIRGQLFDDPDGATIHAGSYKAAAGTVVISMLAGMGACGSPQTCPVRVVFQEPDGRRHVLIGQEEMCASSEFYAIRRDLKAIQACDLIVKLP